MVSGSLYSIGEKTMRLPGNSLWKMAEAHAGITELNFVRTNPVLALSSTDVSMDVSGASAADLEISFNEDNSAFFADSSGNYRVAVSSLVSSVDFRNARLGTGAALFTGSPQISNLFTANPDNKNIIMPIEIKAKSGNALFSGNKRIYDFSIEFWLHPYVLENGEQIILWSANLPKYLNRNASSASFQRISCTANKNKLQWSFNNFFISPDGINNIDIILNGFSTVVPKTWSHHLIRFDSGTGMVEYLVNGKSEAIEYATSTGHEGGEVYAPLTGDGDGSFILGTGFSGMMDEFKIYKAYISDSTVKKYPRQGGRIVTKAIELGIGAGTVQKLDAFGGRISLLNSRINSEYRQNGNFNFSDNSEIQFFMRASENPYQWDNPWQPVIPGKDISVTIKGRYVQIAMDFYPSADGEASPYLEELRITYLPEELPLPPSRLTAIAMDGAVQLQWKNSPNQNTIGYLVYYGTSSDDFFCEDSALGASPIDIGNNTSVKIDGLKNGTLYYFKVAAYSQKNSSSHTGEFSTEVRSRPLKGL